MQRKAILFDCLNDNFREINEITVHDFYILLVEVVKVWLLCFVSEFHEIQVAFILTFFIDLEDLLLKIIKVIYFIIY